MDIDRLAGFLSAIGVDVTSVARGEVNGLCPGHRQRTGKIDHSPSWGINADRLTHHCFSCGYSGSLTSLVSDLKGMDYDDARGYIDDNLPGSLPDIIERLGRVQEASLLPKPVPMSEARLSVYEDPPEYALAHRGLTPTAAARFGVRWNTREQLWILPLRDPDTGTLMGWQEKGEGNRYFKNRPPGMKKSRTLFGWNCWQGPDLLVVESPLDAVKAAGMGYQSAALCGAKVSDDQINLMRAASRLIIAFDNPSIDPAGLAALEFMFQASREKGFDFWSFNYGGAPIKDIGEMIPEEITWGIDNAVHSVRGYKSVTYASERGIG